MSSDGKYTILPEASDANTSLSANQLAEIHRLFGSADGSKKKRKSKKKKGKKDKKAKKNQAAALAYLLEINGVGKKKGKKKSKQSRQKMSEYDFKYRLIEKSANEAIDLVSGIAKLYAINKLGSAGEKSKMLNVVSVQ
ncbi:MAG: hypothetical protein FWC16_01865 [Defluviitaleaceae bacterium]|nr:hypothetical protein [Defluviitaleaceae bacterium]MCL2273645.1 hypothetical protein [Defluviitaleaceae bacterium]